MSGSNRAYYDQLTLPEGFRGNPMEQYGPLQRGAYTTPHARSSVRGFPKLLSVGSFGNPHERSPRQSYGDNFKHNDRAGFDRNTLRMSTKQRGVRGRGTGNMPPVGGSPNSTVAFITCTAGHPLLFSETNLDWSKLNIFRTRLCDRLTQTRTCHMANRCLFSHEVNWPRRTPFLPRSSAATLRYIPVWCPRLAWPPFQGMCDNAGTINWITRAQNWSAVQDQSKCVRGDNCPFVHSVEEFLYHPEVYKTRSCCLANDNNFDEELHSSNCVALCPWYFCPFAHDAYEIRDLRGARYAWHPPPQIVDNHFVARTQGFDALELSIIEFVRRSPNGSSDLYTTPNSPLMALWPQRLPPVLCPAQDSSLKALVGSPNHRIPPFDEMLYYMVVASLMNLLLYPVENFYVPALLSLQCALIAYQLQIPNSLSVGALMSEYHQRFDTSGDLESTNAPSTPSPTLVDTEAITDLFNDTRVAETTTTRVPAPVDNIDVTNILELLRSDDLWNMVEVLEAKNHEI